MKEMHYDRMERGTVITTKPTWRIETRRKEIVDATVLSAVINVKPEEGDAVTVAQIQGVWRIIGLF